MPVIVMMSRVLLASRRMLLKLAFWSNETVKFSSLERLSVMRSPFSPAKPISEASKVSDSTVELQRFSLPPFQNIRTRMGSALSAGGGGSAAAWSVS